MIYLLGIGLVTLAAVLEGWALSIMWGWFIVPVFHAPALRIPYAIGLALVIGMLIHRTSKTKDEADWPTLVISGLITPFLFLGLGWLVKLFI